MSRQAVIALLAGAVVGTSAMAAPTVISIDASQIKTLASGVRGPEGPSELPDGSVAMVEFVAGNILQVKLDGSRDSLAMPGIGVAGTALGRDEALYIVKLNLAKFGPAAPPAGGEKNAAPSSGPPPAGGSSMPASPAAVVRIDLKTHATKTLFTAYQGEELKAPDDLAVDQWGDLWFTDLTEAAVYWGRADGSDLKREITSVPGVNGITLSPDRKTLYIIGNGKLLAYTISGRGQLKQRGGQPAVREVATLDPKLHAPDGMKTEANGDVLLACWEDGILRYSASGELLSQTKVPGYRVINIGFGGKDERTLYLAANPMDSMVGGLLSIPWPRAGIKLP